MQIRAIPGPFNDAVTEWMSDSAPRLSASVYPSNPPDAPYVTKAGILGIAIFAGGTLLTIRAHNSNPADPFLLRNRFVSELGWTVHSRLARLFNASIALGALLFAPVLYKLGFRSKTRIGPTAKLFGFTAIASGSAVGLFPMDDLKSHFVVTLTYFSTWPVTVALFTRAYWQDRTSTDSKLMVPVGIAALVPCALLLVYPKRNLVAAIRALLHHQPFTRPEVWWPAIFEWAVVFCTWLWMAAATATLRRSHPPSSMRERLP